MCPLTKASSSCRVTTGATRGTWWQYLAPPTTATAVAIRQLSWSWTTPSNTHCKCDFKITPKETELHIVVVWDSKISTPVLSSLLYFNLLYSTLLSYSCLVQYSTLVCSTLLYFPHVSLQPPLLSSVSIFKHGQWFSGGVVPLCGRAHLVAIRAAEGYYSRPWAGAAFFRIRSSPCPYYKHTITCVTPTVPFSSPSLQFDPAPRRGEPHVTRRTPDYFL